MLFKKIFSRLNKFQKKEEVFQKEIKSAIKNKNDYISVMYTDGYKSRFFKKYISKLKKGSKIEFKGTANGKWINPSRNPEIKVIFHRKFKEFKGKKEKLIGTLKIGYVSKTKLDSKGEYVYLPKCSFQNSLQKIDEIPAVIYLDSLTEEIEYTGLLLGYGKINGEFEKQGNVIHINLIKSFTPEIKNISFEISLSEAHFGKYYIEVDTKQGLFYCHESNVPFKFSPRYNKMPDLLANQIVSIESTQRKVGHVRREYDEWVEYTKWVEYKYTNHNADISNSRWDFSNCDMNDLVKVIKQEKMDAKYEKILNELKHLNEFKSFSSIKKRIKSTGRTITDNELHDMFFHPGYDKDVFNTLEKKSTETFVDNLSFIFKVKTKNSKTLYIWETPNRTLATYVFNDFISTKQLFARIKETPRMLIRQNKTIQKELGFEGFIIHSNPDVWRDKFDSFLTL
tara:strand:- start:1735 stop:3093 length:1359 start_codon:yes stop_codon:yes gene_type:complete